LAIPLTNISRYGSKLIIEEEMTGGQLLIVRKYSYPSIFVKSTFVFSDVTELFFITTLFAVRKIIFSNCKEGVIEKELTFHNKLTPKPKNKL